MASSRPLENGSSGFCIVIKAASVKQVQSFFDLFFLVGISCVFDARLENARSGQTSVCAPGRRHVRPALEMLAPLLSLSSDPEAGVAGPLIVFHLSSEAVSTVPRSTAELDRGRAEGARSRRRGRRGCRGQRADRVRGGRRKGAAQPLLHPEELQDSCALQDYQSFRGIASDGNIAGESLL